MGAASIANISVMKRKFSLPELGARVAMTHSKFPKKKKKKDTVGFRRILCIFACDSLKNFFYLHNGLQGKFSSSTPRNPQVSIWNRCPSNTISILRNTTCSFCLPLSALLPYRKSTLSSHNFGHLLIGTHTFYKNKNKKKGKK